MSMTENIPSIFSTPRSVQPPDHSGNILAERVMVGSWSDDSEEKTVHPVPLPAVKEEPRLSTERCGSPVFAYPSETTKGSRAIVRALLMATVSSR
jgi:hypothetical protein